MTVIQLIKELTKFPPAMEVVATRYSDYGKVNTVELITAIQEGGWVRDIRSYQREADERKAHGFVFLGVE